MNRDITLIEGIDVGQVPPTPTTGSIDPTFLTKTRSILLGHATAFGFPISFSQEQNGAVTQNVFPIQNTESMQISTSSKVELGLHTETAFHRFKPSAILLLCLRGDPNAVTTYAYVDDIAKQLKPATLSTLTRLWFTTSIDESFRTNGERDMEITCSILDEVVSDTTDRYASRINPIYNICFDEALMKGTNEQAIEALGQLQDAVKYCTRQIVLKTGDLLVLNNKTTIHGRRPFTARYDGTDRWVQRMLVIDSIPPSSYIKKHINHTEIIPLNTQPVTHRQAQTALPR